MRKQAVNANQEYFEPISKVALLRGKIEESLEELTTDAVVVNLKEVSGFKKKACSICGKVMLRSSLRRHVREIHEARMKKSFGDKEKFFYDSLQLQPKPLVQKSTEALKKFECFLCKQELSTKKRLEDHIRNIHEERRRFFCDFCNSCYWKRDSIYRHMKTHLETNKKDRGNATLPQQFFECWVPKCHQKFMNKRQLSLHCSKHHNKGKFKEILIQKLN